VAEKRRKPKPTPTRPTCAASLVWKAIRYKLGSAADFVVQGGALAVGNYGRIFERKRGPCLCAELGSCGKPAMDRRGADLFTASSADHTGAYPPMSGNRSPSPLWRDRRVIPWLACREWLAGDGSGD